MLVKPPIKPFVVISLFSLLGGLLLGIIMLDRLARGEATYQFIWPHVHLLLVGFMLSLIYGLGYQLIPSIFGRRLVNKRLPYVHLVLHVLGVLIMVIGVFLARWDEINLIFYRIASFGGLLVVFGGVIFVYNIATLQPPHHLIQLSK